MTAPVGPLTMTPEWERMIRERAVRDENTLLHEIDALRALVERQRRVIDAADELRSSGLYLNARDVLRQGAENRYDAARTALMDGK